MALEQEEEVYRVPFHGELYVTAESMEVALARVTTWANQLKTLDRPLIVAEFDIDRDGVSTRDGEDPPGASEEFSR